DNGQKVNEKHIIQIRALLGLWVEYFLDDYNKIKNKISHCINNSDENKCKYDCPNKCNCVEKWVEKKRGEWEKIRKRFLEQYNDKDQEDYNVKTILEEFKERPEFKNAIKPCGSLDDFQNSKECAVDANSQNGKKRDVVECLLEKLRKEAEKCQNQNKNQASVETQDQHSDDTKTSCNVPPDVEDEEPLEEENPVTQPNICPTPPKPQAEEKGACDPATIPEAPPEPAPPSSSAEETAGPAADGEQKPEEEAPAPPEVPKEDEKVSPPQNLFDHPAVIPALVTSTLAWSVGIGFAAFTYFYLKKKTKSSVGSLFQILQIPKGDYGIPTLKSSNRYIPYASERYKGKTYIYMEGDTSGDEDKYAFMSDTTDVTSSESEYEELDINDIYVPGSPKYKTLIEVVLEPSKRDIQSDDTPSSDTPMNKFTDEEWNQLKHDFISQYIQSEPLDVTKSDVSTELPMNIVGNVLDDGMDEKPFIMSIHDRNLYIGQEYSYDMSTNSGGNGSYSGISPISDNADSLSDKNGPTSGNHNLYSGTDLINDALNGDYDIYDEILKRKENELFGTYHTKKNTSTNSVAKNTNSDPILNQINLFHTWLDRHRDMCDQWDKNKKEELLDKLKKEWNKENNNNGDKTYNSDNKPSHNHVIYIQVPMMEHIIIEVNCGILQNYKCPNEPLHHYISYNKRQTNKNHIDHYENVNYKHHLIMIMTKKGHLCCNNLIIAHHNDYENMKKECKEQCEKDIQKIILKDKIEKELTEKFATLQTDITTEDIPTCICEKSLSGKVEKTCFKCGGLLGGGLEPTVGLLGTVAVNQLTKATAVASIEFATQEGIKSGIKAVVDNLINMLHFFDVTRDIWLTLINSKN
ncbi:hypothetical protein PFMC_06005, partial [Plasmodium falciparum CAMP/Malaysia]